MPRHAQTPPTARWQPTWRRVGTTSVGAFVVVLGFLAGRMSGGADPGIADPTKASRTSAHQKAATSTSSTPSTTAPSYSQDPGGYSQDTSGYSSVAPDPNPPTTHSS